MSATGRRAAPPAAGRGGLPGYRLFAWPVVGLLLARSTIAGVPSPLGLGFLAAVAMRGRGRALWATALGVSAGILTAQRGLRAAECLGFAGLLTLAGFLGARPRPSQRGAVAGRASRVWLCGLAAKLAAVAAAGPSVHGVMLAVLESAVVALTALVFAAGGPLPGEGAREGGQTGQMIACLVATAGGVVLGFPEVTVLGCSVKLAAAAFSVLAAGFLWGPGAGAAAGVALDALLYLAGRAGSQAETAYGLAGLLCGAFRGFGRVWAGGAFALGNIPVLFHAARGETVAARLMESAAACVALRLVPSAWLQRLAGFAVRVSPAGRAESAGQLREAVGSKVEALGKCLLGLASAFAGVAESAGGERGSFGKICNSIAGQVCESCGIYRTCWENDFSQTYKAVFDLLAVAKARGGVEPGHVPRTISRRCKRVRELATAVNDVFQAYRADAERRQKLGEGRELVRRQLLGLSQRLCGLAADVRTGLSLKEEIHAAVAGALRRLGIDYRSVDAAVSGEEVEIGISGRACRGAGQCLQVVAPAVSRVLGREFTVQRTRCMLKTGKRQCSFSLSTSPAYAVVVGAAGVPRSGSEVSGDTAGARSVSSRRFALILSDGMGTGPAAAAESAAAARLVEHLLAGGFAESFAVETANAAMAFRGDGESFASIDLALFDLGMGKVEFVKLGAAPSFVKCGAMVTVVRSSSPPAGVVGGLPVEIVSRQLEPGDLVVLASDGLLACERERSGEEEVARFLRESGEEDPGMLAQALVAWAKEATEGRIADDVTVLVGRLVEKSPERSGGRFDV